MKRSYFPTTSKDPKKNAIKKLDIAFSLMIRERDRAELCIACSKPHMDYQAGHYRRRELMSTRFNPMNVNAEGSTCNQGHTRKYGIKDMDVYRRNLDLKWGKGVADELFKQSEMQKQWTINELNSLRDACKKGYKVYVQLYGEIMKPLFQ